MLKKIAAVFGVALLSSQANASGIDLRLADETAEIMYLTQTSTFGYGGTDVGLGVFFNENDDLALTGSISVTGHGAGNNRALQFGAGVKLYVISLDTPNDDSGGGLGIGGQVRYVFPSTMPFAILAEG